jgi:hypothetical protein
MKRKPDFAIRICERINIAIEPFIAYEPFIVTHPFTANDCYMERTRSHKRAIFMGESFHWRAIYTGEAFSLASHFYGRHIPRLQMGGRGVTEKAHALIGAAAWQNKEIGGRGAKNQLPALTGTFRLISSALRLV